MAVSERAATAGVSRASEGGWRTASGPGLRDGVVRGWLPKRLVGVELPAVADLQHPDLVVTKGEDNPPVESPRCDSSQRPVAYSLPFCPFLERYRHRGCRHAEARCVCSIWIGVHEQRLAPVRGNPRYILCDIRYELLEIRRSTRRAGIESTHGPSTRHQSASLECL